MELIKDIEHALSVMQSQRERYQGLAKRILSWVNLARRPMTPLELQHALAIRPSLTELKERDLPDLEFLRSICAGLVFVEKDSNTVRFTNRFWQHFQSNQGPWCAGGQADITVACIAYLKFDAFKSGPCSSDAEFVERLQQNPFYDYASRNWGYHAALATSAELKEEVLLDFLKDGPSVSASVQAIIASRFNTSDTGYSQWIPGQITAMHLAAHFGLQDMVVFLEAHGFHPDSRDSYHRTPLSWAAENGSEGAVQCLLDRYHVDPNSRDKDGMTPLSWSSKGGHIKLLKLLFDYDVTLNSKEDPVVPTVRLALESGHDEVIKVTGPNQYTPQEHKEESSNYNVSDLKGLIEGNWSGNYYYKYASSSRRKDPVAFTLSVVRECTDMSRVLITGDGQDAYGQFTIYGYIKCNCEILLAKTYETYGWIYSGKVYIGSKTMTGWWGRHDQDIQGTFVFYQDYEDTLKPSPLDKSSQETPDITNNNGSEIVPATRTSSTTSTKIEVLEDQPDPTLCRECNRINFALMGFHKKDLESRFHATRDLSFTVLSEMAKDCRLCRHFLEIFHSKAIRVSQGHIVQNMSMDESTLAVYNNDFYNYTDQTCLRYLSLHFRVIANTSEKEVSTIRASFQRATPESMTVHAACERYPDLEWPPIEHGTARWRPLTIDFALLRKWMHFCDRRHKHETYIPSTRRVELRRIRLIDVNQRCLVEQSPDKDTQQWGISWVVLSYVWGKAKVTCLTNKSLAEFQTKAFFQPGVVPKTIMDAIEVVQALGKQYLWVDSCCIIQDSDDDKAEFISHMDIVYGLATLTIVNAAGNHADHGLPGVHQGTRSNDQKPFLAKGTQVVEILDPGTFGTRGTDSYLENTTWDSRGWTLQEGVLSQRLLIFTSEQVYWECQKATWCEDSHWETQSKDSGDDNIFHHIQLESLKLEKLWNTDIESFDKMYRHLVQMYSMRQLTSEEDYLNAFTGIANSLEFISKSKFFWGIPSQSMANGLAWSRPGYLNNRGWKTRPGGCKLKFGQRFCQVSFPSWSWVSFVGGHLFYVDRQILNGPDAGLIFHIINQQGHMEELPHNTESETHGTVQSGESIAQWKGTKQSVSTEDVPESLLQSDLAPMLLLFYSSIAQLDALAFPEGQISTFYKGRNIQTSWGQEPTLPLGWSKVKLVIINIWDGLGEQGEASLVALAVKEDKACVLYRIGLLFISEKEWNSIAEKKWDLVLLG